MYDYLYTGGGMEEKVIKRYEYEDKEFLSKLGLSGELRIIVQTGSKIIVETIVGGG